MQITLLLTYLGALFFMVRALYRKGVAGSIQSMADAYLADADKIPFGEVTVIGFDELGRLQLSIDRSEYDRRIAVVKHSLLLFCEARGAGYAD